MLVVDDEGESLALVKVGLSDVEAELVCVTSGAEALVRLEKEVFAMVLLDVSMPSMDGFEVSRRIRASERRWGCLPVILITGVDRDEQSSDMGYGSGAVDYVSKPVSFKVLRHKVEVFLTLFNERKAWEAANDRHLELQNQFRTADL
jgi:two-component system cell cycle response regulator